MRSSLFIAFRYLFAKKKHNVINVISAISTIAMAIGTAALILILSVFNGFDEIIKTNLSDLDPDIKISRVDSRRFDPDTEELKCLFERFKNISMVLEDNVFLSYDSRQAIAKAKGVEDSFENESKLSEHIVAGEMSLHFGELSQALLGSELARSLGVNPRFSEKIEFYYPADPEAGLWGINSVRILPRGIFSISSVVDKELIIIPLDQMRELLSEDSRVSSLEIRSSDTGPKILKEISSHIGPDYKVENRQMQNSSLFKMMSYEKLALYAILIFVVVIIAFNIYASLSMLVLEKEEDIFQLGAMGLRGSKIRRIFVLEGFLSSFLGVIAGLVLGLLVAFVQVRWGLFKMPSGFLVSAYPCVVQFSDVLLTFVGVSAVGVVISLLFSLKMTKFVNEK